MTTVKTIAGDFDKARYDRLKKTYNKAIRAATPAEIYPKFMFDGGEMLCSFAKYLIEFLDPHFKNMK